MTGITLRRNNKLDPRDSTRLPLMIPHSSTSHWQTAQYCSRPPPAAAAAIICCVQHHRSIAVRRACTVGHDRETFRIPPLMSVTDEA